VKYGLPGKTIIYASRKQRFYNFCDQFIVLDQGRIAKQGESKEEFKELLGNMENEEENLGSILVNF
jgi:ABC-type polysaccharide/polyol phosphate transport system ATPase subunit